MVSGICAIQVTQLVAQNLTRTTLPLRSDVWNCRPSSAVNVTSGAALDEVIMKPPAMAATTRMAGRIIFFMDIRVYSRGKVCTPPEEGFASVPGTVVGAPSLPAAEFTRLPDTMSKTLI